MRLFVTVAILVLGHPSLGFADDKRSADAREPVAAAPDTGSRRSSLRDERHWFYLFGDLPQLGPDDALVTVITFGDYGCARCVELRPIRETLRERYGDDLRVVFAPLSAEDEPQTAAAARAAWAAHQQGRFWDYHDALYEHHDALGEALYTRLAGDYDLDMERFDADRASETTAEDMEAIATALPLGLEFVAPLILVNGRVVDAALEREALFELIDFEIRLAHDLMEIVDVPRHEIYEALAR